MCIRDRYNYPGLWTQADFHVPCAVNNFSSAANVQDCELFTLPDLDTGSPAVRQKLADYLIALARLGVAGFRVDAAKHNQQVDPDDIFDRGKHTLTPDGAPYQCAASEGRCVLKQCRDDVAAFQRKTCLVARTPEAKAECEAALGACEIGGETCKFLACVNDSLGNFTDGRQVMVGR